MAFCKNCGSEMEENAQFCPKCGASSNGQPVQNQQSGDIIWGILGIVFAFFSIILGLVFSIIAINKYPQGSQGHKLGKIGLWLSIAFLIVSVVLIVGYFILIAAGVFIPANIY